MNRKKSTNPRYSEESKRQIVDLYLSGKPATTLAKEYGLARQTIYRWQKHYAPLININKQETVSLKDYKELQKKIEKKILQLELEDEILRKSYRYIHHNTTDEIVAFINKYQDQYPIQLMCKLLKISRGTYYKAIKQMRYNKKCYTQQNLKQYLKS